MYSLIARKQQNQYSNSGLEDSKNVMVFFHGMSLQEHLCVCVCILYFSRELQKPIG